MKKLILFVAFCLMGLSSGPAEGAVSWDPDSTRFRYAVVKNEGFFVWKNDLAPYYHYNPGENKTEYFYNSGQGDPGDYDKTASGEVLEFSDEGIPGDIRMAIMAMGPENGVDPPAGIQVQAFSEITYNELSADHGVDVHQEAITWIKRELTVEAQGDYAVEILFDGSADFDTFYNNISHNAQAAVDATVALDEIQMHGDELISIIPVAGFPVSLTESERSVRVPVTLVNQIAGTDYSVEYQLTVRLALDVNLINFDYASGNIMAPLSGSFTLAGPNAPFQLSAQVFDYGPDYDEDGLTDSLEYENGCPAYNDADSDDDGIPDGTEDANRNGEVDDDETDPCDPDSDNDGVQDGTELGYTLADINPAYTDTAIFQPDLDPLSTTSPVDPDSDDDTFSDGEEDKNKNGRVDDGEGDPNDDQSQPSTPGDLNNDEAVDLTDAVISLQIVSGIEPAETVNPGAEVSGDQKIGPEEAVYILQKISDLRE